ncbi:hypothetical protein BT63DRAFT_430081, partial [Microthyrium microscopicum]
MAELRLTFALIADVLKIITSIKRLARVRLAFDNSDGPKKVLQQLGNVNDILTSLHLAQYTFNKSEFNETWTSSTNLVLGSLQKTLSELCQRLRPRNGMKWPLRPKEEYFLTMRLEGYAQMLTWSQVSFSQGTNEAAEKLKAEIRAIDDVRHTFLSSSEIFGTADCPKIPSETQLMSTSSSFCDDKSTGTGYGSIHTVCSKKLASKHHDDEAIMVDWKRKTTVPARKFKIKAKWNGTLRVNKEGESINFATELGKGKIMFAVEPAAQQFWVVYQHEGKKNLESRWCCPLTKDFYVVYAAKWPNRPWDHDAKSQSKAKERPLFRAGLVHPSDSDSAEETSLVLQLHGFTPDLKANNFGSTVNNCDLTINVNSVELKKLGHQSGWNGNHGDVRQVGFINNLSYSLQEELTRVNAKRAAKSLADSMNPPKWR